MPGSRNTGGIWFPGPQPILDIALGLGFLVISHGAPGDILMSRLLTSDVRYRKFRWNVEEWTSGIRRFSPESSTPGNAFCATVLDVIVTTHYGTYRWAKAYLRLCRTADCELLFEL